MQQVGHCDVVANFVLLSVENHPHGPTPGEKKAAPALGAAFTIMRIGGTGTSARLPRSLRWYYPVQVLRVPRMPWLSGNPSPSGCRLAWFRIKQRMPLRALGYNIRGAQRESRQISSDGCGLAGHENSAITPRDRRKQFCYH